jgi:HEAT repeat protein
MVLAALSFVISNQAAGEDPKDPPKSPSKSADYFKWPKEISGKDLNAWLKDLNDPDPAMREAALRTIPAFGPEVQKAAGKLLVARLNAEPDPGVKLTLFGTIATVGFDEKDKATEAEALRIIATAADVAGKGSATRLQALQAVGAFGPRAYGVVPLVAGQSVGDTSYETRRIVANTLGRIGFNETKGPSLRALHTLSGSLAKDICVSVRMEALQSLVLLGPPWAEVRKPDDKKIPKLDQEGADVVADHMRHRLGISTSKNPMVKAPKEPPEPDKQLEIWCRVVLMRFDPKEITPANLSAIGKHISATELGPKLQSLQALALFGERAEGQLDAIVSALGDDEPLVLNTTLTALAAMGVKAQGAIPELEKMEKKWADLRAKKMEENLKNKQFNEAFGKLEQKEKDQLIATMAEEQCRVGISKTIEWIKKSKPGMPGGDPPMAPEPKKQP